MPRRGTFQTTPARMGAPKSSSVRLGHRGFDKHDAVPQKRGPGGAAPEADQSAAQFQPAARIHGVSDRPVAQTPLPEQICRTPGFARGGVCDRLLVGAGAPQ